MIVEALMVAAMAQPTMDSAVDRVRMRQGVIDYRDNHEERGAGGSGSGNTDKELASKIFVGIGVAYIDSTDNNRIDEAKIVTLPDGDQLVQITEDGGEDIRAVLEAHYLGEDDIYGLLGPQCDKDVTQRTKPCSKDSRPERTAKAIGKLVSCGPFAFVPSTVSDGCGPFIAATLDDNLFGQVGLGWMIGIGGSNSDLGSGFTLGVGAMFDDGAAVLNEQVVDPATIRVREEFRDQIAGEPSALTIEDEDVSVIVYFGKAIGAPLSGSGGQ